LQTHSIRFKDFIDIFDKMEKARSSGMSTLTFLFLPTTRFSISIYFRVWTTIVTCTVKIRLRDWRQKKNSLPGKSQVIRLLIPGKPTNINFTDNPIIRSSIQKKVMIWQEKRLKNLNRLRREGERMNLSTKKKIAVGLGEANEKWRRLD